MPTASKDNAKTAIKDKAALIARIRDCAIIDLGNISVFSGFVGLNILIDNLPAII